MCTHDGELSHMTESKYILGVNEPPKLSTNDEDTTVVEDNTYQDPLDSIFPPPKDKIVSLEEAMLELDNTQNTTQYIRTQMLRKLTPLVASLEVETNIAADPDLFQAQSRFISEVRGLLNDMDTSSKTHTAVKLKQSTLDTQKQSSVNAAELLAQLRLTNDLIVKQVTSNTRTPTEDEIEQHLAKSYEAADELTILDTELELGGSMLPRHQDNHDE